ncbi:uncharacterized protein FIBRA_08670 [Fibroporia radiculosa]|uniref:AAA protein C-terminal winged helix domain-containing protein n=1 Tax=Fibroporia radiculosa TaxID=599839 RepID=J4H5A7_9APHY|nr:uncharacterized protein FIBRA_08670 [Fibroporia radiculosa]CCM06409.1 predicted protein [Fibroporia radiculosa]
MSRSASAVSLSLLRIVRSAKHVQHPSRLSLIRHASQRALAESASSRNENDNRLEQSGVVAKTEGSAANHNASGSTAGGRVPSTGSSAADAVITTLIGLAAVFFGGIAYVSWYKKNVLDKIELAFARGYDPALEVASSAKAQNNSDKDERGAANSIHMQHMRRQEQDLVDNIIGGREAGQYFMLLGCKGTGKGTMILDAMQGIQAEGVAVCDAHPNLEVFRLRLGRALNYEFNEDTQTGLFQRRDPREGGAALDIERALSKLEKVALRYACRTGRPLVLVLNNIHFFNNDDDGRNMLLQLQQRAESWAAGGILTMVFSTDDFWPFLVMRKVASRMQVVSVRDLSLQDAIHASAHMRLSARDEAADPAMVREAVSVVGGRLSYLSRVSRAQDMRSCAHDMLAVEKAWLQSQIGLIPDCDDDVMDEQKWSSCSWLLLREFVRQREEDERARDEAIASGMLDPGEATQELPLPKIPYYKCRQIMTRTDFLEDLDRANIIAIDTSHDVMPDSVLLLHAAKAVVEEEGFGELLDNVRARVDEIESLHRTRELTFKDVNAGDRIWLSVDKGGSLSVDR